MHNIPFETIIMSLIIYICISRTRYIIRSFVFIFKKAHFIENENKSALNSVFYFGEGIVIVFLERKVKCNSLHRILFLLGLILDGKRRRFVRNLINVITTKAAFEFITVRWMCLLCIVWGCFNEFKRATNSDTARRLKGAYRLPKKSL